MIAQLKNTRHGAQRLNQRGLSNKVSIFWEYGTASISGKEIMMKNQEIERVIRQNKMQIQKNLSENKKLKAEIQNLEKTRNAKIVVYGDCVITAYKMTRRGRKKCRIQMASAA